MWRYNVTLEYHNSVNMRDRKTPDTLKDAQRSKDYVYKVFKQKYGIRYAHNRHTFKKKVGQKNGHFFLFFRKSVFFENSLQ